MDRWRLIAALFVAALAPAASAQPPEITLDWVGIHELTLCNPPDDRKAFESAKLEAERRLPEFRHAWAKHGPIWLKEAEALVGRPFQYREALATLTVCPGRPWATSYPLLIGLERFLAAYDGPYRNHELREEVFAELLFHEVLHRYVRDIVGPGAGQPLADTPLMKRYANEPFYTRSHLHLMAIERLLFQKLGHGELLRIVRQDHQIAPAYARVYEIVDREGAETIVADLRDYRRQ